MVNQEEFNDNLEKFDELENRGSYYPMFLNMIEKGLNIEAFLFILSTWNFAVFRYVMKEFNLRNFKETIENLKPYFKKFESETIETINLNNYEKDIKYLFETLSKIKGIQYTGASKLMHLTIPKVFIMWDGYIRKAWGFKKGDAEDYVTFLKKMQKEFKGICKKKERTLAKCIDEYNYIKFTLPGLEKKKRKGNKS